MNALTRTAMNVVLPRARASLAARASPPARAMGGESRQHLHKGMPTSLAELRNSIWLSDIGALPVVFVVTFAVGMCSSYIGYCALCNPDVRIAPGRRQSLVRTWE